MWQLFAWVAANQGGVPIPVVPSLVGAGALAGAGHASLVVTVAVIVAASLIADLAWYGIGRWRGAQALALLGGLSRHAFVRVKAAEQRFVAHQLGFLFGSRFLPEANPVAAGMAGATHIGPARYILIATASALAWAGMWTGAGYALGNVTTGVPTPFSIVTTLVLLAGVITSVGFALKHRRRHAIVLVAVALLACAGYAMGQ